MDIFNYTEKDGTEVACYMYHVTQADDLYMIQGETLNDLAWIHIQGIAPALQFWEKIKKGNIINKIRGA